MMFFNYVGIEKMDIPADRLSHGFGLWLQQFTAILAVRFHHLRRNHRAFLSQIIFPSIFIAIAMAASFVRPSTAELPLLKLTTEIFTKPNAIFVQDNNKDDLSLSLMTSYVRQPTPGEIENIENIKDDKQLCDVRLCFPIM